MSFGRILPLPRSWRPGEPPGFGGVPVATEAGGSSPGTGLPSSRTDPADSPSSPPPPGTREAVRGLIPFGILVALVVAATGPWSHPSDCNFVEPEVDAVSSPPWTLVLLASLLLIAPFYRGVPPSASQP